MRLRTILALASGKAGYNIQHSTFNIAPGNHSTFNTQHSTFISSILRLKYYT